MSETYQHIYVSAGDINNSPFYDFYIDASGSQELTPTNTLYLDTSYVFHRLEEATSHPFYISDVSYEQPHSSNIRLTGDGSYNDGITGSETLTLEFTGLDTSDNLYYYCTAHSNMVNAFTLVETTPLVDTTAPTLSSIIPLLDASNVAIDSNFTFTFSEDVSGSTGNITIYDNSDNVIEIIDVSSVNVSVLNNEVTVNPVSDLSYSTSYYVNIDADAFEDGAGNAFTGLDSSSNSGMRFTTEEEPDIIAPTLVSFSPILNTTDISANTDLVFTFDENVFIVGDGEITIYDASTNVVIQEINSLSDNISISGEIVTASLTNNLSYNTSYYVNIDPDIIGDEANNAFTGLDSSSNSGMRFTTEIDTYSPILSSVTPVLNATDISINTNLEFNFNEDISANSGNITLYDASSNSALQVFDISSSDVSISGNQVTVTLQTDLSFDTSYYVNIDSGTFQDALGNSFIGLDSSSNSGMRFTTASDYIGPVITDISPLLNAIDVSINSNLEFTFDEDISDGSGNITILDASTNTIIQTIDVSGTSVDISGNRAIVSLPTNLPYITPLYVNIDAGAFQDIFGNDFAGLNSSVVDTGMRFSTEVDLIPPTLVSVSPLLNATDISINSNLVFTFSEDMVDASGNIYLYDSSTNELLNTFDVTSDNISISGSQVTLNPSIDLSFNRSFYVNIDSGAFEDEGGNIYTGLNSSGSDTGMRFTTERDVTIPTITNISPDLNATNVPISTNLTFTFSETIVDGSGNILVYRSSDDTLIRSFDVSSSEVTISGNEVVIVNPFVDLSYNTLFYVNIDAGAFKDLRDNEFTGLDSSSLDTGMRFTTELDLIKPTISAISPLLDATDISLNSNIELTFSEDVVIGRGNIIIYRSSNDIILQVIDVTDPNVTLNRNQVIINPDRELPPELSLYINIDSGAFKDLRGNDFAGLDSSSLNTGIRFTTEQSAGDPDIISPTLISIYPELNATKVKQGISLVFNFSEKPILDVNGNISLYRASDDTIIQTFDVTGPHVTITGTQVVVKPPVILPPNTLIYVNIGSNALLDSAGNNFGGLDSSIPDTGMRFTTIDPTKTRLFDIVRFCQDKKCQQDINYKRLNTGGNDPSMSSSMRYAQYVRGNGSRR